MREPWGVVLAGGSSRRMGRDKATLRLGGGTLLERAVAVLHEALDDVAIVGRSASDAAIPGVASIPDRSPGHGPLGGILTALERRPDRPVFALACDLPGVTAELVRWLIAESRERRAPVVYPEVDGERQPLCGLWSPASRAPLAAALAAGRLRVLEAVDRLAAPPITLAAGHPLYRPGLLVNLNRPADVALAPR